MRDRITRAIREAMKSGDKARLTTLRLISAAIKDRDIATRVDTQGEPTGREQADDREILALLQKMIKQRRESISAYRQGGRIDLADKEAAEIAVIEEFLPEPMSDEQMQEAVTEIINELGCASLKDMGRTVAALKQRYVGQMDFSKASTLIKEHLKL